MTHAAPTLKDDLILKMIFFQVIPDKDYNILVTPRKTGASKTYMHFRFPGHWVTVS
jgi:hypothetical protein